MRTLTSLLAIAWLACVTQTSGAATPGSEAFEAGKVAFAEQDYLRALSHFQKARDEGLEGPAIHYNLAVCHYRLGDYPNAASVFRIVADRYPAMRGLAQYNLGLVAQKRGEEAQAQAFFRQALANSGDEKVRSLAQRQLGGTTAVAAEPRRWVGLVDAHLGHDDNVLLVDNDILLPDGQSGESPFTELFAMVSAPLSRSGFRFDASAYAVSFADVDGFDQTALRLGGAYQWRWGAWRAEAGPHYSYSTLDGDGLEQRVGVGFVFKRPLGAQATFGLRYVHDEASEGEDRFAFLDGTREWLELSVDHRSRQGRLTFAYAVEANDRADPNVSPTRDKLSFRYRQAFTPRWLADLRISLRDSRYDDLSAPREEDLTELSLAMRRNLQSGWQFNSVLSVAENDSNVSTVAYERRQLSLGVSKQF